MQTLKMSLLVALLALATMIAGASISAAQDDDEVKEAEPVEGAIPSGGGVNAVIPGVETQGFGNTYVLLDSTNPGGPKFNTPAYSPTTLAAVVSAADDNFEMLPLGFAFEFFGTAYANVYVSSNGALTFGSGDTSFTNEDLSTSLFFTVPTIFAFLDDLAPFNGGDVWYDTFGPAGRRVFVVEYDDVPTLAANTSAGTFQVRLFEGSNYIEVHYYDVQFGNSHDFGGSATVGIREGDAGTAYLQYVNLSAQIEDGLALRYWEPKCFGQTATMVGDRGNEILSGTAGNDVIHGHAGNDVIDGLDGNDRVCGGRGDDTISTHAGADKVNGGTGNDIIDGGTGADDLKGGGGIDTLIGGPGDDTIAGNGAPDVIDGGPGDDTIDGQNGGDQLTGGSGNDTIRGHTGPDIFFGGPDDDILLGGNGADTLYGGGGVDKCAGNLGPDLAQAATCELTPGVETLF